MAELEAIHFMTHFNGDYEAFYPKSEADRYIAHQKRKRCMAWVKYFELREDEFGGDFSKRWLKKWRELAEKFKEEK